MKKIFCSVMLICLFIIGTADWTLADCTLNCSFKGTLKADDLILTQKPWIDVRAFGAKGDGSHDDTIAIQKAINSGTSAQSIVFFPQGAYRISSKLKIGPNVTLQGVGVGWGTQILPVSTDAITVVGTDFPQFNHSTFQNRIKEMMINMSLDPGYTAIKIDGAYNVKIEDVAVHYGSAGSSGNGITISSSANVVLFNVRVEGVGNGTGNGITIDHSEVKIYNVDLERFFNGITINHANGTVHIFGGYMESMGGYGILFNNSSFNSVEGMDITAPNSSGNPIGFLGSPGSPSEQNSIIGSTLNIANATPGISVYQDANSKDNLVVNSMMTNGSIVAKGNNHLSVINSGAQFGKIQVGGGNMITGHLSRTASLNFSAPDTVPGNVDRSITVTGAALGDTVTVGAPVPVGSNYILTAFISSADSVTIRWTQISGLPASPAKEGIYRADVWKHEP